MFSQSCVTHSWDRSRHGLGRWGGKGPGLRRGRALARGGRRVDGLVRGGWIPHNTHPPFTTPAPSLFQQPPPALSQHLPPPPSSDQAPTPSPHQYGQCAGGTHPTGMHTCYPFRSCLPESSVTNSHLF